MVLVEEHFLFPIFFETVSYTCAELHVKRSIHGVKIEGKTEPKMTGEVIFPSVFSAFVGLLFVTGSQNLIFFSFFVTEVFFFEEKKLIIVAFPFPGIFSHWKRARE